MSKAYGYGLMSQKLNTLQSLVLTPTPTPTPTLQQVLTEDNTASLDIQIQDANSTTLVKTTGLEISDAIGGIPKLNTIDSNIIQIDRDESSTTGDVYLAQYRQYGSSLNTTTTASGNFIASYAYDQMNLNKVIGATTTDLTVTSNLITSNDTLGITANTLNLNGQTVFDIPPHCAIDPTTGIDLANKGYVDSLVGQYSGGYNLYFNYSVTDPTYSTFQSLGQTVVAAAQQTVINNITSGTQEVARFITLPIGITTIPIGLWDALVYGAVSGTGGDVHYYFELYKKTALNVDTLLVTSGISPDVNASPSTNPTSYTMNATITSPITLDLTDRLFMILYVTKTGVNTINLTTYFQNDFYSFTQSTLNAGTTLLSSNNTWTGTNKFDLAVNVDSIQTNAIGTTANLFTTQTTGDFNLLTSKTSGNVNILTGGSRGGTTNILTASGTANTLNIGSGNLTTQFNGLLYSGNLDQIGNLNVGTSSATTLTIGRTGNTATNLRGASVAISGNTAVTGTLSSTSTITGTGLISPSLSTAAAGTAITLYTANTGQCDILTSTSRTGTLNIQTAGTGANAINIGSATSTTTIKGILKNNEITTEAVSDNMAVCNGLSKSGTLSIQAASTVTNTIEIGSTTSTTNIKGLRVTNIDSIASGAMSIGATNTTGINFNNKVLSGLTYGVNSFVTLSTNTTSPLVNQLGYNYQVASVAGPVSVSTSVSGTIASFTSLPVGVWFIEVNSVIGGTASAIGTATSISSVLNTFGGSRALTIVPSVSQWFRLTTILVNTSTATTWYFNALAGAVGQTISTITIQATRIA
jgi:hypothetical protein